MRKTKTIVEFKCDRCETETERNISKDSGLLIDIEVTKCYDMTYGNKTKNEYNLCQKCSNELKIFLENKEHPLQHYYDATVGLWATDNPEQIPLALKDKYFWQLEK